MSGKDSVRIPAGSLTFLVVTEGLTIPTAPLRFSFPLAILVLSTDLPPLTASPPRPRGLHLRFLLVSSAVDPSLPDLLQVEDISHGNRTDT